MNNLRFIYFVTVLSILFFSCEKNKKLDIQSPQSVIKQIDVYEKFLENEIDIKIEDTYQYFSSFKYAEDVFLVVQSIDFISSYEIIAFSISGELLWSKQFPSSELLKWSLDKIKIIDGKIYRLNSGSLFVNDLFTGELILESQISFPNCDLFTEFLMDESFEDQLIAYNLCCPVNNIELNLFKIDPISGVITETLNQSYFENTHSLAKPKLRINDTEKFLYLLSANKENDTTYSSIRAINLNTDSVVWELKDELISSSNFIPSWYHLSINELEEILVYTTGSIYGTCDINTGEILISQSNTSSFCKSYPINTFGNGLILPSNFSGQGARFLSLRTNDLIWENSEFTACDKLAYSNENNLIGLDNTNLTRGTIFVIDNFTGKTKYRITHPKATFYKKIYYDENKNKIYALASKTNNVTEIASILTFSIPQ